MQIFLNNALRKGTPQLVVQECGAGIVVTAAAYLVKPETYLNG